MLRAAATRIFLKGEIERAIAKKQLEPWVREIPILPLSAGQLQLENNTISSGLGTNTLSKASRRRIGIVAVLEGE